VIEVRWHARAGQGAKTAAHLLAMGFMRGGSYAQAFPEYGPERRGAPLRAFTRASSTPIRRHDSITHPTVAVVLEPSLLADLDLSDAASVLVAEPGTGDVNLVMLGAVSRTLGGPPLDDLHAAACEVLGRKADPDAMRAALEEGYAWAS
jgi:Pyruvate/2-oxoacid:ferredoxin oxidoreductase gamma subunit